MNSLRHRIIDIRGQSIWANKSALERSETASLEIEAFPPPGFLPTFTAHIRKDLSGFIGDLFRLIGKYVPPPSGLKPAALWGTEERLRELFGDGITSLRTTKRDFVFRYRSASHWLDHFGVYYGPMVTTLKALDATRQEQFSREVISLLESYNRAKDGTLTVPSEYLEAVAIRR